MYKTVISLLLPEVVKFKPNHSLSSFWILPSALAIQFLFFQLRMFLCEYPYSLKVPTNKEIFFVLLYRNLFKRFAFPPFRFQLQRKNSSAIVKKRAKFLVGQ